MIKFPRDVFGRRSYLVYLPPAPVDRTPAFSKGGANAAPHLRRYDGPRESYRTRVMRSFLKILNRLITVRGEKRPSETSPDVQFTCSCAKAKKTFRNVGHQRKRWRWSYRSARSHRSVTHPTTGFQRSTECTDSRPPALPEGTRRAPLLGTAQPPRSPRPPFEESIRSFTRRTPGSEDAASIETEVGYPVVGPITPRTGHQNLRSTFFHQNEVVYSQDVSTNTPHTEPINVSNVPLIRTFSDVLPSAVDRVTVTGDEDLVRVSTESQTIASEAAPMLWLPTLPMLSGITEADISSSVSGPPQTDHPTNLAGALSAPCSLELPTTTATVEEHLQQMVLPSILEPLSKPINTDNDLPVLRLPKVPIRSAKTEEQRHEDFSPSHSEPAQEGHRTARPTIGTEFSPFRPVPQATDAAQSPHQDGRLPKKFYFPSQMRRNRSNTDDSNCPGHRKNSFTSEDAETCHPEFGTRTCRSSRSGRSTGERNGSWVLGIQTDDSLTRLVHSPHVLGSCKVTSALEEPPSSATEFSAMLARQNFQSPQSQSKEALTAQNTLFDAQKLNINSCVSWPDISTNATDTDNVQQNDEVRPKSYPCLTINKEKTTYEIWEKLTSEEQKCADNIPEEKSLLKPFLTPEADLFMSVLPIPEVSLTERTTASQILDSEIHAHMSDGATQYIFEDLAQRIGYLRPSSEFSTSHDETLSGFLKLRPPNSSFIEPFCEGLSSNKRPSYTQCFRLKLVESEHRSPEKTIQLLDLPEPTNKIYGLGHNSIIPSVFVKSSQQIQKRIGILEKDDNGGTEDHLASLSNKLYQTIEPLHKVKSEDAATKMPLPLVTVPEMERKDSAVEQDTVGSIDIQNHLFVKKAHDISVASSVYIGDDGEAAVTKNAMLANAPSSYAPGDTGTYVQAGVVLKRELGAKPKIRRETLGLRKKMFSLNDDSLVGDRSSAIDDSQNLLARGHRVERNRGSARNQISSKKKNFGIIEPHRPPRRCPRSTPFESSRKQSFGLAVGELRSIWINPQTERSFRSSDSTIDVTADFSRTFLLKSSCSINEAETPRPQTVTRSKSPNRSVGICGAPNEFDISMFQCAICKDSLKPPIQNCIAGHNVCAKCLNQGDSCPVCSSLVPTDCNKVRDKLLRNIRFPCENRLAGCRETYGIESQAKHETRCLYRQRTCPLAKCSRINCTWKGMRSGIRSHMKKRHAHAGIVHPFRTFFTVETFDSKMWINHAYDIEIIFVENEIFELHKGFDTRKSCVWGLLRHIIAKDVMQRYNYSIRFQPKNIRSSVTFTCEAIEGAEELEKAFERGKRFKFYLDSFSEEPLQVFSIYLKVVPRTATLFHNVL